MNFERDPNIDDYYKYTRLLLVMMAVIVLLLVIVLTTLITGCSHNKRVCDAYGNGKYYKSQHK